MKRWTLCMAALVASQAAAIVAAEDVVVLRGTDDAAGRASTRVAGTVLDFTGTELRLQLPSGREMKYPAARVAAVETTRLPPHEQGEAAFARGQWQAAGEAFRAAATAEQRPWVRRQILGRLVWCQQAQGNWATAGELFLALVQNDPATPDLAAIPLAWTTAPPAAAVQAQAHKWLARADLPAARLRGASHLLTSGDRAAAQAVLRDLAAGAPAPLDLLAQAQLWRLQWAEVSADQLAAWEHLIARLPEPLRAGSYFVRGRAWSQRGEPERAALDFLRVPVHYPRQPLLAAEALLAAGGELEKLADPAAAARLYRELIEKYPDAPLVPTARSRWESLARPSGEQ